LNEGQLSIWRGKSVGIVFQFFQLLPMLSLLENILLPMDFAGIIPPGDRETRAMALLNQVGLDSLAGNLPSDLSGGQLQHAAIARALANDPPIIMADEPTGNLDTKNARAVFDLFESLAETGKTILMVTHDDSLANMAGRKLIISDGELLDEQITRFFSFLSHAQLLNLSHAARTVTLGPQDILPIIDMPVLLWSIEGEGVIRLTRTNDADSSLIKIDSGQIFGVDDHSSGGIIACSLQSGSGIRVILASGPDFRRCVDHAPVLSGYIKGIPSSSVPDFYQETGDFGQVKP
jgi:energy-coupling factor transporter ATP-binding protein EcfA2